MDDHRTLVTDRQLSLTSRPFMTRLIVEIKARCDDHDRIRSFLTSRRAVFRGTDRQVDTYFKVNHGRLKLREGTIENFLVCYDRPAAAAGVKLSRAAISAADVSPPDRDR